MPELPEVETIRRGVRKLILNKKIVRVSIFCEKSFVGESKVICNAGIIDVIRRGKALIFLFQNGMAMMVHLRMTGQIIYVGKERFAGGHPSENFLVELPNNQTRVEFDFSDGSKMFFNDQRKFGFCKILKVSEIENEEFIKKLGKEPWEMTGLELYEKIKGKNAPIKAILLDQSVIAGLGNIYADETLFASGIRAERKGKDVSLDECEKIVKNARRVMEKSIESGGSTIRNYVKADGTRGDYLRLFARVYGREGEKCKKCGGIIKKTKAAGRGTYYCEECQK